MPGKNILPGNRYIKKFQPVIDSWFEALDLYCKRLYNEDNPWWYNERATVSTLAGAAWRTTGWGALEEFSTEKLRGKDKDRLVLDHPSNGRCDLYIWNEKFLYVAEAKQCLYIVHRNKLPKMGKIYKLINDATEDVNRLDEDVDYKIAISFVTPIMKLVDTDADIIINDTMEEWLSYVSKDLTKHYKGIRMDWYIAENPRKMQTGSGSGYVFPGVLLLMKQVK
jgi:hypothetical protein